MNLPPEIKRNEKCMKIIGAYLETGSRGDKWIRSQIKDMEKINTNDRTIKNQVKLCILYHTLTHIPLSYKENILEPYCSSCEIHKFIQENEELDNLLTRKVEIEAEYKVICDCLKKAGVIT